VKPYVVMVCIGGLLAWGAAVHAQDVPGCGTLDNAYGPFDYRDPVNKQDNLPIVETFHFTPDVESLRRGRSGTVIDDLRYTLRAFPNHHRALAAVARYGLGGGHMPEDSNIPSVACFFERAVVFAPDDAVVRAVYANFLFKSGKREEAHEQYEEALRLAPESTEINYAAGLYYLEIGDLERAKASAEIAYGNGYPLPGLRKKIAAAESAARRK